MFAEAEPPLSQSRTVGDLVFVSGQIGVEADGTIPADFRRQAELAIASLGDVLDAAGSSMGKVVKTTVFITDAADFEAMNEVYRAHFQAPWPARSTVVSGLVLPSLLFEIEAVASAT